MPSHLPSILVLGVVVIAAPAGAFRVAGTTIERPLATVTQASLADAIRNAGGYMSGHRGASVTIRLPAGIFDLSRNAGRGQAAINVSKIDACPGTLTIAGAGMDRTTIIKSSDFTGIAGHGTSCVTFADMTLKQERIEVTQGRVVTVEPAAVVLDVPRGFPTPGELAAAPAIRTKRGLPRFWLKPYRLTPTGPELIHPPRNVRWTGAQAVPGGSNRWRVSVIAKRPLTIETGDYLAVKAKLGGQAYRFTNGSDITFRNIRWVNDARGKFRKVNRVTIAGCVITRHAPIGGVPFFMATSGGGPQIGHRSMRTSGHLVENNRFEGLGDDPVNLTFASGIVRNNRISDAGRGVLLVASPDVKLENNVLLRAPVLRRPGGRKKAPIEAQAQGPSEVSGE